MSMYVWHHVGTSSSRDFSGSSSSGGSKGRFRVTTSLASMYVSPLAGFASASRVSFMCSSMASLVVRSSGFCSGSGATSHASKSTWSGFCCVRMTPL